jgi:O-antigen/teichoic acid export membrane protein
MRRDILTAYLATGAKIASWAMVTAAVYRFGRPEFALLALVRATLGLLNYTSLGLGPAMIRILAESKPEQVAEPASENPVHPVISYRRAALADPARDAYSNGLVVASIAAIAGLVLVLGYALLFDRLHELPQRINLRAAHGVVIWRGVGTILRLMSDASGAVLQTRGLIALDNKCLIAAEISWVIWTIIFSISLSMGGSAWLASGLAVDATAAAYGFAASGVVLWGSRFGLAAQYTGIVVPRWGSVHGTIVRQLLAFGALVSLAQVADFLYAPVDYILINRLINPNTVATYAPAVQIDSALLILMAGVSMVLLPRAALAHAAQDHQTLRRYYIRGTVGGALVLLGAALVVWLTAPRLLRLWLGLHWAHADTLAILPLVLIHTIVGGSSAVGRSILLGMGKVKPFAASVLIAGAANVILSFIFVKYLDLGLRGIIYGTIIAVIGRCALWMPWYVLRALRPGHAGAERSAAPDPSV